MERESNRKRKIMEIEEVVMDRISDLPDNILHHIMSLLPSRRCAARTSILSKHWNYIWSSFPIFDFCQDFAYLYKFHNFIEIVDSSMKRFIPFKRRVERFCIEVNLDYDYDSSLPSVVDRWIEFAMENGVREVKLVFKSSNIVSKFYVLPETTFIRSSPKSIENAKYYSRFHSLKKLILKSVHISEKMIKDIIRNCPELYCLSLQLCWGLKVLEISKLDKLEYVEVVPPGDIIELKRIDIDAPNLRSISFHNSIESDVSCSISLTSCHNLKELVLAECYIREDFFHLNNNHFRFPLLEELDISDCQMPRRIKIFGPRLRTFCLSRCENIELIEIDAPTLSLFQLEVYELPVLLSKNVPCTLEIDLLNSKSQAADASRFLELRKFVGTWTQRSILKLQVGIDKVSFHLQELQQVAVPPPLQVEHLILDLSILTSMPTSLDQLATLIDGLLWSCHPKTISIYKFSGLKKEIIQILSGKLFSKESPKCCNFYHVKCRCHCLKSAQIVDYGGTKHEKVLDPKQLLETMLPLHTHYYDKWYDNLRYKLEWELDLCGELWPKQI